jgi:hypothetical protein
MTSKENETTAEDALKLKISALRRWTYPGDPKLEGLIRGAVAQNVLHEDLGLHADEPRYYDLDQETRDRLLAHARQDAAHALINTEDILDQLAIITRRFSVAAILFLVAALFLAAAVGSFWVMWWHR